MTKESGQMLIVVIAALGVVLFTVLFIIAGAQVYFQNSFYSVQAEKSFALAEAGIDKAVNSLNKTGGSYNGETETLLSDGSYSVTVTDIDAATKQLSVTGYIPNKTAAKVTRTIKIQASKGVGLAFNYGLQVGEGGLSMGNGSILNGSVYSNGNVLGGNSSRITGDVYVAGGVQPAADQQSDCEGVNCQEYIFGKIISGEERQDVAQSFKPSQTNILNKVALKLRKAGNPSNPTVRIMRDSGGNPDKNGVLATGILSANLVSTQTPASFVDVTFNQTPSLNENTTYWIMIHASSLDNSNFWYWSSDLAQSYGNGVPKWSPDWQAKTPVWSTILGDFGFQTFMGGVITSVNLGSSSQIAGDVHANSILGYMTINGDAYYQTIGSSVTVNGTSYPGSLDPVPAVFPISQANITDWQNQALAGGVSGSVNGCTMTIGPKKIEGDLTLDNSCTVTVRTPLWITGNITTGNSTKFILDPSYGATSGVIIVEGTTTFGNGSDIKGTTAPGSYLMLLSIYDSRQSGIAAVNTGNSSISGIIYAPSGKISLPNGASFKEITAWQIELGNSAILNYDTGLSSIVFSSGPTGAYTIVKGTYQAK